MATADTGDRTQSKLLLKADRHYPDIGADDSKVTILCDGVTESLLKHPNHQVFG